MLELIDGQSARLDGDTLYVGDVIVAMGTLLDRDMVEAAMTEARAGLASSSRRLRPTRWSTSGANASCCSTASGFLTS